MYLNGVYIYLVFLSVIYLVHATQIDVIDKVPGEVAQVTYPSGAKVDNGNELTPTQAKDEPTVTWLSDDKLFYTVAMVDPDAPTLKEPTGRQVLHWLVGNVPGGNIKNVTPLAEYAGPAPPKDTGLHRYIILVYQQTGKIIFSEENIDTWTPEGRLNFSIRNFADKYNLGQPIAGNFFRAQFEA